MEIPYRGKQEDVVSISTNETTAEKENERNEVMSLNVSKPPSSNITTNSNHISPQKMHETKEDDVDSDLENYDKEEYAISKIMDAVRMLKNETDLRPRITFLDFAGQSIYYAFHQIFLNPNSCSILVMDVTKGLNEKVDVSDTNEKCCSLFKSLTYRGK